MHILDELWVQTYINLADFPLFGKRKLSNRKSSPALAAQHFQTLENLPCWRRNISRCWKTSRAGGATFPDAGKPPALAAQHFQTLENLPCWRRNISRRWKTSRASGATFPDAGKPPALAAQRFQTLEKGSLSK